MIERAMYGDARDAIYAEAMQWRNAIKEAEAEEKRLLDSAAVENRRKADRISRAIKRFKLRSSIPHSDSEDERYMREFKAELIRIKNDL